MLVFLKRCHSLCLLVASEQFAKSGQQAFAVNQTPLRPTEPRHELAKLTRSVPRGRDAFHAPRALPVDPFLGVEDGIGEVVSLGVRHGRPPRQPDEASGDQGGHDVPRG